MGENSVNSSSRESRWRHCRRLFFIFLGLALLVSVVGAVSSIGHYGRQRNAINRLQARGVRLGFAKNPGHIRLRRIFAWATGEGLILHPVVTVDVSGLPEVADLVDAIVALNSTRAFIARRTRLDDATFKRIAAKLTMLRLVDVSWTNIADESVRVFTRMPALESLDISHTAVSDDGILQLVNDSEGLNVRVGPTADAAVRDAITSRRSPGRVHLVAPEK